MSPRFIQFTSFCHHRAITLFIVLFSLNLATGQQQDFIPLEREGRYASPQDTSLPDWIRAMYAADPNLIEVERLYKAWYAQHPFEKNEHTQYYKRWTRTYRPYVNAGGFIRLPTKKGFDAHWATLEAQRLAQEQAAQDRGPSAWGAANWKGIGPFDFDKDAAGRSHAPGAAHVYTMEKAPSNPDVLYCGTATAGVWKSINRGLNWTCVTTQLPINYCNALEIHPSDPNTVLIGANGRVYKSTDGGQNWSTIGDAAFNNLSHDVREIAYKPGTPSILFVASDKGFYRSPDGGNNFTQLIGPKPGAYFSELEFKPNDPNTLYIILSEVNDKYSEFYKSTDGGSSFTLLSGWPVLSSASTVVNQFIERPGGALNYASFGNDNLGGASIPDFTLEMRVRFPATTIYDKAILSNKNWSSGNNAGWVLGARYTGQLTFNMGTGSSRVDLHTSGIWDDSWHFITIVYRANGLKELYKDGVLATSTSTSVGANVGTSLPMILGYDGNLNYGGHDMKVDEIRIFNTALSAATISAWTNTEADNTHPNYGSLIHQYKCNEASGNILFDATGGSNGSISGTVNRLTDQSHYSTTSLGANDHQKRAEIAVTAANPDRIYALLSGSANGGEGLYGVYVSNNAGVSWTHKCCGSGPGGAAIATPITGVTTPESNANILGYSETGNSEGGQYYYDLALAADPGNANKVHLGGINHWYSSDGGTTFNLTAKWSWPDDPEYVHADIHNIAIYENEVWINCDGGIFMSADSGKINFNARQYGIQGSDFWGFGMGHKDGDVMLGGTYHNSHLMKNNDVYLNGWVSYTGSADGTRGFVNPGKAKTVYNDSGKDVLPANRNTNPYRTTFSELPNTGGTPSKITWDPRCYNCLYTGNDGDLWYSEDDGDNFTLVKNFDPMDVADIEVLWSDPKVLYVCTVGGFYDPKAIWKTTDRGVTWTNITPSSTNLGFASDMSFDIAVSDNSNELWLACFHPYGWNSGNNNKVFYSADGGASWTSWNTATTNGQSINNILYQRGSNGGIYLGTRTGVLYRDKSMSDWVLYEQGLPKNISSQSIFAWYKEGKLRNASNRSVWESPMHTLGYPVAQPMADKRSSFCSRDTIYFADYSAHYKTDASWHWNISPAPAYISSTTVENPKVVFGASGVYTVSLTVTDSMGSSTRALQEGFVVNSACDPDTIPGKALKITANTDYAAATNSTNLNSNTVTLMAWVKPSITHTGTTGILFIRGGTTVCGINLENNNRLAYHWNNAFYGFNSNLFLPTNKWSHVAMVVEPTKTTLYLNGKAAVSTGTHPAEAFDAPFNMGRDPGYTTRTFKGLIDEVCLYKRALSQDEIREQMHFVKKPASDPDLVSYYQFNEANGPDILDRASLFHARLSGATRDNSTGPFGTGVSHRATVGGSGSYNFGNTGVSMTFPGSGTYPNGELCVSRLYIQPDVLPTGVGASCHHYWIVNNHGTNATFSPLTDISFKKIGSTVANDPLYLHKRGTGDDGSTWGISIATTTTGAAAANADVTFAGNNINSFSQFNVSAQNSPLPVEWLSFDLHTKQNPNRVFLQWETAAENQVDYFEVERSDVSGTFESIARIIASGNSTHTNTYQTSDAQPLRGISYYRIKQTGKDGSFSYSEMKAARFDDLHQQFTLRPNPVNDGAYFTVETALEGFHLCCTNAEGRKILDGPLNAGLNHFSTESLPAGVYFLRITDGSYACLKKLVVE